MGILVVIAVYVAANIAYLRVLPADAVRASGTLATDAARKLMGGAGARFISAAIVVSSFGFIDMTILTAPRVFYAMAADGLSTAAMVLGPERGLELLRAQGVGGLVIAANGEMRQLNL